MTAGAVVDLNVTLEQARKALGNGRYAEAQALLSRVVHEHPSFADAHNLLGFALSMTDEPVRAEAHFHRALELNPSYAEAHLNLAIVLNERSAYHAARKHLRKFNEIVQKSEQDLPEVVVDDLAQRHAKLARQYRSYGLVEESEEQLRKAVRLCPNYHDLRLQYAELLFERAKLSECAAQVDWILQRRPGYDNALLLLGRLQQERGEATAARETWKKVRHGKAAVQAKAFLRAAGRSARFDAEGLGGERRTG